MPSQEVNEQLRRDSRPVAGQYRTPGRKTPAALGFRCSRQDMLETGKRPGDIHRNQEGEANRFAIELLAPLARVRPYVLSTADLANVLAIADDLDNSREGTVTGSCPAQHEASVGTCPMRPLLRATASWRQL